MARSSDAHFFPDRIAAFRTPWTSAFVHNRHVQDIERRHELRADAAATHRRERDQFRSDSIPAAAARSVSIPATDRDDGEVALALRRAAWDASRVHVPPAMLDETYLARASAARSQALRAKAASAARRRTTLDSNPSMVLIAQRALPPSPSNDLLIRYLTRIPQPGEGTVYNLFYNRLPGRLGSQETAVWRRYSEWLDLLMKAAAIRSPVRYHFIVLEPHALPFAP